MCVPRHVCLSVSVHVSVSVSSAVFRSHWFLVSCCMQVSSTTNSWVTLWPPLLLQPTEVQTELQTHIPMCIYIADIY